MFVKPSYRSIGRERTARNWDLSLMVSALADAQMA